MQPARISNDVLKPERAKSCPIRQYTDKDVYRFLREDKKLNPKITSVLENMFDIKLDILPSSSTLLLSRVLNLK